MLHYWQADFPAEEYYWYFEIDIECTSESVLENAKIKSDIRFCCILPFEIWICQTGYEITNILTGNTGPEIICVCLSAPNVA